MPAPTVTATIAKNGVPLGVFNLAGPPSLSTSPDSYDNSTMFSGVVPGSWVSSGMQVTVEVATSPPMQFTFTPAVASPTKFTVVAVPIQVGVTTGLVPPAGALKDALARIYPVANQDIVIEIGSPLSVNVPTPVTGTELARSTSHSCSARPTSRPRFFMASSLFRDAAGRNSYDGPRPLHPGSD